MGKILIVYFSRRGENYVNGKICRLERGNTEVVAGQIAALTGGERFELETVEPYPADYHACTDAAMAELRANARPALKGLPRGLEEADTIFLGYPNWWGTMPMAVCTFLENCRLDGKRILPFCTNEGSGMGRSEADLRRLCPGARIGSGLSIHGAEAARSGRMVEAWVRRALKQ